MLSITVGMVRVVCFDVGGVLIRITHRWLEAAHHAGLDVSSTIAPEAGLTDFPLFGAYQRGEIVDGDYLAELAKYLGVPSSADALSIHNHIMVEPYPQVDELVSNVKVAGLLSGCLSNTNAPHWHDMFHSGRFPANEAIEVRLASHEVGLEKPDPLIFRQFELDCGHSGSEVTFFDDSAPNVEAAISLGWHAFQVDPDRPTVPQIRGRLLDLGVAV